MVEKILQVFPTTIHDKDFNEKNIVLLAVENRQSHLYDFLLRSSHLDKDLIAFHAVDRDKNNALHLAAMLKNYESSLIPSSRLQMQWEVKWYEVCKIDFLISGLNFSQGVTFELLIVNTVTWGHVLGINAVCEEFLATEFLYSSSYGWKDARTDIHRNA